MPDSDDDAAVVGVLLEDEQNDMFPEEEENSPGEDLKDGVRDLLKTAIRGESLMTLTPNEMKFWNSGSDADRGITMLL